MPRTLIVLTLTYLLTTLLSSCTKSPLPELETNQIVTFSTKSEQAESRVTENTWQDGDQIGVFMVRQSASLEWETIVDEAFNKCYVTSGDGLFTPLTPGDEIRAPRDGEVVNFVAYYPYRADLERGTPCLYGLDLSEQGADIGFIVSRNLEGVKVNGTPLALEFARPLSVVQINISSQFDASLLQGLKVKISGIKHNKADYALLKTGNQFLNPQQATDAIEALVSQDGTMAQMTLLSQPNVLMLDARIAFELQDGRLLNHTLSSELPLVAGRRHTYNILLLDDSTQEYFEILPRQIQEVEVEGASRSAMMLSKNNWEMLSCPAWVSCLPSKGNGSPLPQDLTLTFGINYNGEERQGEIIFQEAGSGAQVSLPVSQLSFSTTIRDARFLMDNGSVVFDVTTFAARDINPQMLLWSYHATWQGSVRLVMEPQSWIRFSTRNDYITPVSNRVTWSIENNNSSQPREVLLRLEKYADAQPVKFFKIVQLGATDYLELSASRFTSRAKGDLFSLTVTSRYDWTVEDLPAWITLTRGSTTSNKTGITLTTSNNQGPARSATIKIVSGSLSQTIQVDQAAKVVQNYPFPLYYSIIVDATGAPDAEFRFNGLGGLQDVYANLVSINPMPGVDGVPPEEVRSFSPFGYVTDPPMAKHIISDPVAGSTLVLRNYSGAQTTVPWLNVAISYYPGWTYIRRADIRNLPVPPGLTHEDKLIYTLKMTNVVNSSTFNYSVSYVVR